MATVIFSIERKEVKTTSLDRTISMMKNNGRYVPDGEYTFLYRGNTLVMSDTPNEKRDHYKAIYNAKGRCLIAGLGIGMVLNAIAQKEEVTHIDVVELSSEVIQLVAPYYLKLYPNKITFHNYSIFDWKPEKNTKYDMAWFDIWDNLCIDNLEEMSKLHRKFGKSAKWKGSWGKELLQYEREKEKNRYWR